MAKRPAHGRMGSDSHNLRAYSVRESFEVRWIDVLHEEIYDVLARRKDGADRHSVSDAPFRDERLGRVCKDPSERAVLRVGTLPAEIANHTRYFQRPSAPSIVHTRRVESIRPPFERNGEALNIGLGWGRVGVSPVHGAAARLFDTRCRAMLRTALRRCGPLHRLAA